MSTRRHFLKVAAVATAAAAPVAVLAGTPSPNADDLDREIERQLEEWIQAIQKTDLWKPDPRHYELFPELEPGSAKDIDNGARAYIARLCMGF